MKIIKKSSITLLLIPLAVLFGSSVIAQDFSSHWGINAHVPSHAAMDKMVECGITWFRADFPSSDNNNWDIYDQLVTGSKARGLEFFATIFPSWAGEPPAGGWDRWEDFVYRIVLHFKGSVRYWGIGNELNSEPQWTLDQYVELVKRAYAGAKRADSTSQIVAPEFYYGGQWQQQLAYFLDHALNYVDVIDHHYYLENIPTADAVLQEVDATRQILEAHGAANKPFWITETGLPSKTSGEEIQANFFTGMSDGVAARPWIQKLFFYDLVDNPGEHPKLWGILRTDLSPKPAFFAYQAAIAAYKKPLVVSSTSPANGSQQVPLNSVVAIQFSRGVNQASVLNALSITPSFEFASEWSVHTLSIIPTARLLPLTTYSIKVSASAVSVIGDSLDGNRNGVYEGSPGDDFLFSFTTGTTGKPGLVLASSPRQGTVGVTGSAIQLTFQLPMDRTSVESVFSISPAIGSGFFSWERKRIVTFYPFGSFKAGTFYTVTVRNTAKDQWGYPLDGNENGISDSEDDYRLYFVSGGKGYYAIEGKVPREIGTNEVDTVNVVLPDTINLVAASSGRIRMVMKGLVDTSQFTVSINGSVAAEIRSVSGSDIGYRLVEARADGTVLKKGVNTIVMENRGVGLVKVWPMVLILDYMTGVQSVQAAPLNYQLGQNYPNPFNPATNIEYAVSSREYVSIKVYDVLGRVVRTLVQEFKSPGVYQVEFNASDLPSGVYFYRLTTSQFTDTKKMIVGR